MSDKLFLKIDFRFSLSPMKAAECTGPNSDFLVVGFILKDELKTQHSTKHKITLVQVFAKVVFLLKVDVYIQQTTKQS
jgi:hypothetical protein